MNVPDVEAAAKEVEASFVPLLQEIPGFVGYYFIAPGGGLHRYLGVGERAGPAAEPSPQGENVLTYFRHFP